MMFTHCISGEAGKALCKHLLNQAKTSQFQVDFSIHETTATFYKRLSNVILLILYLLTKHPNAIIHIVWKCLYIPISNIFNRVRLCLYILALDL